MMVQWVTRCETSNCFWPCLLFLNKRTFQITHHSICIEWYRLHWKMQSILSNTHYCSAHALNLVLQQNWSTNIEYNKFSLTQIAFLPLFLNLLKEYIHYKNLLRSCWQLHQPDVISCLDSKYQSKNIDVSFTNFSLTL